MVSIHVDNILHCVSVVSYEPQTPIRAYIRADRARGSGNMEMWRDQSDRLLCNQHYVMH